MNKKTYPEFDAAKDKQKIVDFLKDWFAKNGSPNTKAVVGISGGKDSSVAAALCVEALGQERVIGVLMPDGEQSDIDDAIHLVEHLGIGYTIINIGSVTRELQQQAAGGKRCNGYTGIDLTPELVQNMPPRLRMTTLYAVAQGVTGGGRVINTCNRSEDYVGYSTKFGDSAGDVAPLAAYTVSEVLAIGDVLGLPRELVHKAPSDGLCGKTDEEKLGFSYAVLDEYIKTGVCEDEDTKVKIDRLHVMNKHKLELLPVVER